MLDPGVPPAKAALDYIRGGQNGLLGNPPEPYTQTQWDDAMSSYRQAIATIVYLLAQNSTLR